MPVLFTCTFYEVPQPSLQALWSGLEPVWIQWCNLCCVGQDRSPPAQTALCRNPAEPKWQRNKAAALRWCLVEAEDTSNTFGRKKQCYLQRLQRPEEICSRALNQVIIWQHYELSRVFFLMCIFNYGMIVTALHSWKTRGFQVTSTPGKKQRMLSIIRKVSFKRKVHFPIQKHDCKDTAFSTCTLVKGGSIPRHTNIQSKQTEPLQTVLQDVLKDGAMLQD